MPRGSKHPNMRVQHPQATVGVVPGAFGSLEVLGCRLSDVALAAPVTYRIGSGFWVPIYYCIYGLEPRNLLDG